MSFFRRRTFVHERPLHNTTTMILAKRTGLLLGSVVRQKHSSGWSGGSGAFFSTTTTTADYFGVVEERRRRSLFGTLMTTHHSRWFFTTKGALGDDTKIIIVDGNSSRGGRRRRDDDDDDDDGAERRRRRHGEREDVSSPRRRRLFGETARAFSAYADVLEKNPSSSSSSSSSSSATPSGMGTYRGGAGGGGGGEKRATSKYENIRVPDPFALVQKELQFITERMRAAVQTDLPALANAAEYFFKYGAEGKRMRPTVLLLMASALAPVSSGRVASGNVGRRMSSAFTSSSARSGANEGEETVDLSPAHEVPSDNRQRQRRLAEITELIHVASLLHDDVLDGSATRRGLRALNLEVGNKLAILAGDFLLARASVTLASLRNVEVIELLSRVLEHLVKGEVMQMTQVKEEENENRGASSSSSSSSSSSPSSSIERYIEKSYYKTASLIGNSAKAVVLLGGHSSETSEIAERFGRHLGLAFQFRDDVLDYVGDSSLLGKPTLGDLREGIATAPVLFAAEKFPELHSLIKRRFKEIGDVERAAKLVFESDGIEMASNLANEHRNLALDALEELPDIDCEFANTCRAALREITNRAVDRKK